MENQELINRILLVADISNFDYCCINHAVKTWAKNYHDDSSLYLKPIEETDQENLPNILVSNYFKRELRKAVQNKLESLLWMAKNNHQEDIDIADGIDVFFTEDDKIDGNFRKLKYPEYKSNRKLILRNFNISIIKDYVQDVIFKELEVETKLGYKIVKVPNCESDDIIAILMKRFSNYRCRILFSSDKDFLQLENVHQYDMWGKKVERVIRNHEDMTMTPDEFRLWKIIRGDISDNIKGVFPKYGDVKSYKLVKDKPTLKQMLRESQESANRYLLNKFLIDFKSIPQETEDKIYSVLCEKMKEVEFKTKVDEFSLEGCMDL